MLTHVQCADAAISAIITLAPKNRMAACLENLDMSRNSTAAKKVGELTKSQGNVTEKYCQGKLLITNFMSGARTLAWCIA